jgi:hypothetical protein
MLVARPPRGYDWIMEGLLFGPLAAVVVFVYMLARRGRGRALISSLLFFTGVPAAPSLPGLMYLFPGRGAPPDPDPRPAISGPSNPHDKDHLPSAVTSRVSDN